MDVASAPGRGFTLTELVTTLAIVGVMTAIAAPSLLRIQQNETLRGDVYDMLAHINRARWHAVNRQVAVTTCASTDGINCADSHDWTAGWIVFEDVDEDYVHDADEPLLHTGRPASAKALTIAAFGSASEYLRFLPNGRTIENSTLTFCDRRGAAAARAIRVSRSGRARISVGNDGASPLRCPLTL